MRQLHQLAIIRSRTLAALAELRHIGVECQELAVHYASENNQTLAVASRHLRDASIQLQEITTAPMSLVTRHLQDADTCVGDYMKARTFFDVTTPEDDSIGRVRVSRLYE